MDERFEERTRVFIELRHHPGLTDFRDTVYMQRLAVQRDRVTDILRKYRTFRQHFNTIRIEGEFESSLIEYLNKLFDFGEVTLSYFEAPECDRDGLSSQFETAIGNVVATVRTLESSFEEVKDRALEFYIDRLKTMFGDSTYYWVKALWNAFKMGQNSTATTAQLFSSLFLYNPECSEIMNMFVRLL